MFATGLWIRNDFFSDPDLSFLLVSDRDPTPDPDPVSNPKLIFSIILDKHFTFVFPSCKCVRLLIMRR